MRAADQLDFFGEDNEHYKKWVKNTTSVLDLREGDVITWSDGEFSHRATIYHAVMDASGLYVRVVYTKNPPYGSLKERLYYPDERVTLK